MAGPSERTSAAGPPDAPRSGPQPDELPPDLAPQGEEALREISASRGLTRLSRVQSIALTYVVVGLAVWLLLGRALPNDPVELVFGLGDGVPRLALSPGGFATVVGIAFVVAGGLGLADRRTGRLATLSLLIATALLVPLVLTSALALSPSSGMNVLPLLSESLRVATPIALGALAGLWSERSGVVNIGIEGMMLIGAGAGYVVYALAGGGGGPGLYAGVVVAVVAGGLMAGLHALLCVTFHANQIVSGVAINLLALGVTGFLRREVLLSLDVAGTTLPSFALPGLSDLPWVGALFSGRPIFWSMFVIFAATQWVLYRTPWGLRVRSVGEHPHAAETLGVDVRRVRYQAVIVGGLLAGLAGAWFSLETVGQFNDGMTNGRGFIALAALIFGKWRPWPAFGGAVLFGFTEALGRRLQLLDVTIGDFPIPSQFLQVLPFVVTIVVLAGAIGRATPPAANGTPYERTR